MKKVAVLLAEGFEEIEALTPVDILRRADIQCDTLGLSSLEVTGSHAITVKADKVFDGDLSVYDMVVLPGGLPGSEHLRDHTALIAALKEEAEKGKYVTAICAAPIVLEEAGLLEGKQFTCHPSKEEEIQAGSFVSDVVVVDGHIVTSRGAGTALAFAYKLVDLLGGDSQKIAQSIVYDQLFDA